MTTVISCLVVDDEPLACQLLERFIGRVPSLQRIGTCTNAIEAIDMIRKHQPALLFLDIEMPELSGLDLLNTLSSNRPQIVLTTAFSTYALEGFDYDVTDYLLKPIRFERFLKAVNKVHSRAMVPLDPPPVVPVPPDSSDGQTQDDTSTDQILWLKTNKKQIRLPITDILFIESMRDYTHFNLFNQSLRVHIPLSKIEKLLPDEFIRINRSFIVRCSAILSISANAVELTNKKQLPIGVTYREWVKERLKLQL